MAFLGNSTLRVVWSWLNAWLFRKTKKRPESKCYFWDVEAGRFTSVARTRTNAKRLRFRILSPFVLFLQWWRVLHACVFWVIQASSIDGSLSLENPDKGWHEMNSVRESLRRRESAVTLRPTVVSTIAHAASISLAHSPCTKSPKGSAQIRFV